MTDQRPSWTARRKQAARAERRTHREIDPRYATAGILVSTLQDCPHGTRRGYIEYGCRCLDLGPPAPTDPDDPDSPQAPTGCGPVARRAAAQRQRASRQRTQPDRPPSGPAIAQLDQQTWMNTHTTGAPSASIDRSPQGAPPP